MSAKGGTSALSAVAVIPARFQSSRLPGKPLLQAGGRPLIEHVWRRVREASRIERVLVATDDTRIAEAVAAFGGEAEMTSETHRTGSDRIGELLPSLEADVILNVQGDEPEIDPDVLDGLVEILESDPEIGVATAACPFPEDVDPSDPNAVKVVTDRRGRALYFSRAPIPGGKADSTTSPGMGWPLMHLGVYAFRRAEFEAFLASEQGALEQIESLEQLRLLELGIKVGVVTCARAPAGVDTLGEFEAFRARVEGLVGS
ncbi:MAG: 3-deoxy-manno-octulosonate cytidylyltransferase [Planctomycetota bacterium]|nr:3-deoxy-manno-octulosonate cytidylyltransferase [Planctomycetota bacterium]